MKNRDFLLLTGAAAAPVTYASEGVAGDSLGGNLYGAIRQSRARFHRSDILLDDRSYASGGHSFYVGGQTTAQVLSTQLPQVVARPPELLHEISGRNDNISNDAIADTAYNNRTAFAEGALAAGVKMVVLWPTTPDNVSPLSRSSIERLHTRLATWAAIDPTRRRFMNVFSEWINPLELVNARWSHATDAFGSPTADSTHGSITFERLVSPHIAALHSSLGIPQHVLITGPSTTFDPVTNHLVPVNSNNAFMAGTDGHINGADSVNVAGVNQFSADRRWIITTNSGVVFTPTKPSANVQRIALGGTPLADSSSEIRWSGYFFPSVNNGDASRKFRIVAKITAVNVNNVYGLNFNGQSLNTVSLVASGDVWSEAHRYPDNWSEELIIFGGVPLTIPFDSPNIYLEIFFKSGVIPSGYFDIEILAIVPV